MKQNCWEFKKCGREPGGKNVHEFGICPAVIEEKADSINSGKNGGRSCWAVAGSFCEDAGQESFAQNYTECLSCSFYNQVFEEEGKDFVSTQKIHKRILENTDNSSIISLADLS